MIKNLYYDPPFAKKILYFNRVRIPPLLHIFWDYVTLTDSIIIFHNIYNKNGEISLKKGRSALKKLEQMKKLNKELKLPYNYQFHYFSLKLFYFVRKLLYLPDKKKHLDKLLQYEKVYLEHFPYGYKLYTKISRHEIRPFFRFITWLLIRKRSNYRFIDKLLFNKMTAKLILLGYKKMRKNFPEFMDKQAMPIETFLK